MLKKMLKRVWILSIGVLFIHAVPAFSAPTHLADGWMLNSDQGSCSLYRTQKKQFVFMAINSDGSAMLRVHDKHWVMKANQPSEFKLVFGTRDQTISGNSAVTSNGWGGVVAPTNRQFIEKLATANKLLVINSNVEADEVDMRGFRQAVSSLWNCADSLEPTTSHVVASPQLISDFSVIAHELAAIDRVSGTLRFRLDVDEKGEVTGCEILHSSGSSSRDDQACPLLQQQARFRPAIDSTGQPIAATYQRSFVF